MKSEAPTGSRGKYAIRASSEKRKLEILEATRILLSEQGYDQISLRKVATVVGIHLKSLQNYFPSKESLIQSTLEYTSSIYIKASENLPPVADPQQRFEEYIHFLLDDDKNKQSAGFFYQLWARAHVDTLTNDTMHEMYRKYTETIERLVVEINPKINKTRLRQRSVMIGALIEGMMMYVGYGKRRPAEIGDIEAEIVHWCKKLANDE